MRQARNPLLALAADGKDRHGRVNNLGDKPILYLCASPISSTTPEEDLLGDGTIAVGARQGAAIFPDVRRNGGAPHRHRTVLLPSPN